MNLPAHAARAVAATVLFVGLTLPLTARPAAACDVSYGYKPSLSLNKPDFGRGRPCSTGTSLAGAFFLALLALGVLAGGGALAYRKGESTARSTVPAPGPPPLRPEYVPSTPALAAYLHATGIAPPGPGYGSMGGHGGYPTP
jgi:hypothetical protein